MPTMFIMAAVIAMSANAERTTAQEGINVRNETNTTIAMPIKAMMRAINAWSCRVLPKDSPIWLICASGYLLSTSAVRLWYCASLIVPKVINFPLFNPSLTLTRG